jgi:protein AFG1
MIDVHKRVHAVKTTAGHAGLVDPILPVARDLANEASVLCFDEFQVRWGRFLLVGFGF